MSKTLKNAISILCLAAIVLAMLALPAFAAPSDYTVTVSADVDSAKPGEIVTVSVAVSGAQFCAAQMNLAYDADCFEYISTMSGWDDDGDGSLSFLNVNGSGGYWEDGEVLGTFKFMVKDNAPAGETAFCVGANSDVFIVGDWAEGASAEPAKPLEAHQLVNAAVTVTGEQSERAPLSDFGVSSDDGSSTPEQQTIIAGDIRTQQETVSTPEPMKETAAPEEQASESEEDTEISVSVEQEIAEPETAKSANPHLWAAFAALAAVAACVAVITVKKKRKK